MELVGYEDVEARSYEALASLVVYMAGGTEIINVDEVQPVEIN